MIDSSFSFAGIAGAMALAISASVVAQDVVQWRVEDGGNGHWYAVVENVPAKCWQDARTDAELRGAELASLETLLEFDFAKTLVYAGKGPYGAHIGLIQDEDAEEPAGGWRWLSGEPLQYDQWASTLDDAAGCQDTAAFADGSSFGKLDDIYPCDDCEFQSFYPALIEWSADCNGDGIVDYGQIRDGNLRDADANGVPDCCEDPKESSLVTVADYEGDFSATQGKNGWRYEFDQPSAGITRTPLPNFLDYWFRNCKPYCYPSARPAWFHPGYPSDEAVIVSWTPPTAMDFQVVFSGTLQSCSSGLRADLIADDIVIETHTAPMDGYLIEFNTNVPLGTSVRIRLDNLGSGHCDEVIVNDWRILAADCNEDCIPDAFQILDGTFEDADGNGVPDCCDAGTACDRCLGDLNGDGIVGPPDLGILLAVWGTDGGDIEAADINGDGTVNASDLGPLLGAWGPCP